MDSIQMEPQSSHNFKIFIGQNYEVALDQLLQSLLDSPQISNFENFSFLTSNFGELLQCKINPPLETIWVYSALVFQKRNSSKNEPLDQYTAINDLFQLIVSYSASCNSLKSIVLMSAVIYHVHKFVVDLKGNEVKSKKEKKLMRKINGLVDSILAFVNVCCEGMEDSLESLIRPLKDLVCVWIWDEKEKNEGGEERLRLFFPLLGDQTVGKISDGRCSLSELAGYVIAEVFLLKLCLAFRGKDLGKDLQNELRNWVVGSITGLRSSYFFDSLLRMLLGQSLPVASLVISDDEITLRKVLYDAVILVEYSFLNPERLVHLPAKHVKSIALGRLIVTHEAVELFRKHGDQSKALSCINAFSCSNLPSHLIRRINGEMGIKGDADGPNGWSPKAFLRWILNIENRGMQVFDDDMSAYRSKLVLDNSEEDSKLLAYQQKKKSDSDIFYIDNKGEQEDESERDKKMTEAVSASFLAAAHSLQSTEHGGRKRKSGKIEKKHRLKFLKYNLYEDSAPSAEKSTFVDTNGLRSGSDVENPSSDEEEK